MSSEKQKEEKKCQGCLLVRPLVQSQPWYYDGCGCDSAILLCVSCEDSPALRRAIDNKKLTCDKCIAYQMKRKPTKVCDACELKCTNTTFYYCGCGKKLEVCTNCKANWMHATIDEKRNKIDCIHCRPKITKKCNVCERNLSVKDYGWGGVRQCSCGVPIESCESCSVSYLAGAQCQSCKKTGLIRNNLMGKKVRNMGKTIGKTIGKDDDEDVEIVDDILDDAIEHRDEAIALLTIDLKDSEKKIQVQNDLASMRFKNSQKVYGEFQELKEKYRRIQMSLEDTIRMNAVLKQQIDRLNDREHQVQVRIDDYQKQVLEHQKLVLELKEANTRIDELAASQKRSNAICFACMEREPVYAAVPCGHTLTCGPCHMLWWKTSGMIGFPTCPDCRSEITDCQKIYLRIDELPVEEDEDEPQIEGH
jgi:hypothetical protein